MTPTDVRRQGGGAPKPLGAPLGRSAVSGLAAAAVAAIPTSAVSLVLRSPDPILINSASVTVVLLITGIVAGFGWRLAGFGSRPLLRFSAWMAITFCVIVLMGALIEAAPGHPLPHVLTYCAPLAAI